MQKTLIVGNEDASTPVTVIITPPILSSSAGMNMLLYAVVVNVSALAVTENLSESAVVLLAASTRQDTLPIPPASRSTGVVCLVALSPAARESPAGRFIVAVTL